MLTQDEIDRIRDESRVVSERAYNLNKGMAERKGRQEGQQEGKIGAIRMLERLLDKPETPSERFSGVSLNELDRQIADLEQQFQDARR